jgi:shikimate kinase
MDPARHVALVGQMGSGKSTVGRLVAASLGIPFRDNDAELQAREGQTAASIQADAGADELHEVEREVFERLLAEQRPSVIAGAASVITDARVRESLRTCAFVVFLRSSPAVLAERAAQGRHRPLPAHDREALFRRLVAERDHLFTESADLVVDVSDLTPEEVARRVVDAVTDT